jgi:hypothetical protein
VNPLCEEWRNDALHGRHSRAQGGLVRVWRSVKAYSGPSRVGCGIGFEDQLA